MWTSSQALMRPALSSLALAAAMLPAGCAHQSHPLTSDADWQQTLEQWRDAKIIALGEQHDQIAHHEWEAQTVQWLAAQQRLAALVIEMAPRTGSTASLARDASEDAVQQALQWQDAAWPWPRYRGVVMAAVRAGVPVLGGNLPRAQMKQIMGEARYDSHLPADGWQQQLDAIKDGHCGLLPESQFAPMARIQLARDESMAKITANAVQQLVRSGQTVLLVAGRGHVRSDIGVPSWLPSDLQPKVAIVKADSSPTAINLKADKLLTLRGNASQDQCTQLREQWKSRPAPKS